MSITDHPISSTVKVILKHKGTNKTPKGKESCYFITSVSKLYTGYAVRGSLSLMPTYQNHTVLQYDLVFNYKIILQKRHTKIKEEGENGKR